MTIFLEFFQYMTKNGVLKALKKGIIYFRTLLYLIVNIWDMMELVINLNMPQEIMRDVNWA